MFDVQTFDLSIHYQPAMFIFDEMSFQFRVDDVLID
jgi:hypothetical protein